jgi:hypothetical protein
LKFIFFLLLRCALHFFLSRRLFTADIIMYAQPERDGSNRLQKYKNNFSFPRNPAIHKQRGREVQDSSILFFTAP